MNKKMLIIIGVIVLLFGGLYFVNAQKNKQMLEGTDNPYDKENLKQETIDLLDDPNYQNIIVPDELDQRLEEGDSLTVYYFSPTCIHCQRMTPIVAPLAEDMGVDLLQMNLLEYDKMKYYDIEGTPTIVHYENGEEVSRIVGEHPEEDFRMFFDTYVLN